MNSKFKLLDRVYKTNDYIFKFLCNFPKREVVLKQGIEGACYESIRCIFGYNINTAPRIKDKYVKDLILNVSMLDYYVRVSFEKGYVSPRQYEVSGRHIMEIRKMSYGLLRSGEDNEQS